MFLEVLHFRKPHVYGVHIYIHTLYVYNVHMINERIRWHHERAWKIVHWFCIYHPCGDNITMIYNDHMHANRVYNLFSNVFGADEVRATEWIFLCQPQTEFCRAISVLNSVRIREQSALQQRHVARGVGRIRCLGCHFTILRYFTIRSALMWKQLCCLESMAMKQMWSMSDS